MACFLVERGNRGVERAVLKSVRQRADSAKLLKLLQSGRSHRACPQNRSSLKSPGPVPRVHGDTLDPEVFL